VVTHRYRDAGTATTALSKLVAAKPADARLEAWAKADRRLAERLPVEWTSLTEPAVAASVAASLKASDALVLASSMPVRDVNSFAGAGQRPAMVVANRGTSGIDGTMATAAGVSDVLGSNKADGRTLLLIGDLAFLHDLNSLGLIRDRGITVVVVNNDGGGIFSFLPIADHEDLFEPYFGAAHGLQFDSAAALYGISHHQPRSLAELRELLVTTRESSSPAIIEVRTSRQENAEEHRRLQRLVTSWLD
jgi:2-succinyl-5-enolpyruvyl-6-hydroxy-3-cyclohexene-1-carboxylate synthase